MQNAKILFTVADLYTLLSMALNSTVQGAHADRETSGVTYTYIYVYNEQESLGRTNRPLTFQCILFDTTRTAWKTPRLTVLLL
jgi:hypothetical protein